jgi:hypothetical protein
MMPTSVARPASSSATPSVPRPSTPPSNAANAVVPTGGRAKATDVLELTANGKRLSFTNPPPVKSLQQKLAQRSSNPSSSPSSSGSQSSQRVSQRVSQPVSQRVSDDQKKINEALARLSPGNPEAQATVTNADDEEVTLTFRLNPDTGEIRMEETGTSMITAIAPGQTSSSYSIDSLKGPTIFDIPDSVTRLQQELAPESSNSSLSSSSSSGSPSSQPVSEEVQRQIGQELEKLSRENPKAIATVFDPDMKPVALIFTLDPQTGNIQMEQVGPGSITNIPPGQTSSSYHFNRNSNKHISFTIPPSVTRLQREIAQESSNAR